MENKTVELDYEDCEFFEDLVTFLNQPDESCMKYSEGICIKLFKAENLENDKKRYTVIFGER